MERKCVSWGIGATSLPSFFSPTIGPTLYLLVLMPPVFFLKYFPDLPVCPVQVPVNLENIKIKKFVLIHGEGFGAWCWYKTVALLEEAGLLPVALDLTGSGIDLTDTNSVTTLADYSKPLTVYLQNLPEDEQVWMCDIELKHVIVHHTAIFHEDGNFAGYSCWS